MENLPAPRPWAPHKSPQVSAAVTTPLPGSTLTQTSDGSTVQGIGALSGKAIKALGNVVLLGLDYVIILARINSILPKFPHTDAQATSIEGVQEMYDMILELSRPKLYSRCITRTALTLVLVQINCGHTRELEQALKRWNYRDCVAFLHTLVSRSMRQGIHINLTGSIVILDPKMIISLMCRIAQQSEQGCQAVLRVGFVQLFLSARTTHFSTSRLADVYRTILYFSQRYERRFRALREEAIQFLAYLISSPRRLFIRALRTWNVNDLRGLVSMVLENTAPSGQLLLSDVTLSTLSLLYRIGGYSTQCKQNIFEAGYLDILLRLETLQHPIREFKKEFEVVLDVLRDHYPLHTTAERSQAMDVLLFQIANDYQYLLWSLNCWSVTEAEGLLQALVDRLRNIIASDSNKQYNGVVPRLVTFIAKNAMYNQQLCEVVIGAGFLNILCSQNEQNKAAKALIIDILQQEKYSSLVKQAAAHFISFQVLRGCGNSWPYQIRKAASLKNRQWN